MFNIQSESGTIRLNKGDLVLFEFYLNTSSEPQLNLYQFVKDNGCYIELIVYMDNNRLYKKFEDSGNITTIINKVPQRPIIVDLPVSSTGNMIIYLDSQDTQLLSEGTYYYDVIANVKLEDGTFTKQTVINKNLFYIM